MTEPLIQKPNQHNSAPFAEMATAIEHNTGQGFGGAVVIVPPEGGGESIQMLMLDSQSNPAVFWSTIKTRIDLRLNELDEKQRRLQGLSR